MAYSSLEQALLDLEKTGQLVRISEEVDPHLEMAEIHRRVYAAAGPALLFERVKGSPFRAASNIYGTIERTEFLFRHTLKKVQKVIALKADPTEFLRKPVHYLGAPFTAITALPRRVRRNSFLKTTIDQLPQVVSWPKDGGAFVTLPQVLTEAPGSSNIMQSNVGMYRIQLSGNEYNPNQEVGLHYQLHRGIGVHHEAYNRSDEPFRCSVFVGGPPSFALAAIFPLPEGLSELTFAGMLGGRRFRYQRTNNSVLATDADFVITGTIHKEMKKPEGPFGDHLGYYSLEHPFPVMEVDQVYHRKNAIWQFTAVGRPPQEDTSFGHMIHQIVEPLLSSEFPGVKEVNAVDAAGVHPLLLAIGSERYMPFREQVPEEILTQANHLLGKGQTSLAKYLIIAADDHQSDISTHRIAGFFQHVLERIDWKRDLHFQTMTTIDTLDYSGSDWNAGSKVVMACCGKPIRVLSTQIPSDFSFPEGIHAPQVVMPGVMALGAAHYSDVESARTEMDRLTWQLRDRPLEGFPLIVLVDDPRFLAEDLNNFLWVTFTRSNPAQDIYGVGSFTTDKHWGCTGSLIIDARTKPHHAPELEVDPEVSKRADRFFSKGGALESVGA